jgi:hypothetical protein
MLGRAQYLSSEALVRSAKYNHGTNIGYNLLARHIQSQKGCVIVLSEKRKCGAEVRTGNEERK